MPVHMWPLSCFEPPVMALLQRSSSFPSFFVCAIVSDACLSFDDWPWHIHYFVSVCLPLFLLSASGPAFPLISSRFVVAPLTNPKRFSEHDSIPHNCCELEAEI